MSLEQGKTRGLKRLREGRPRPEGPELKMLSQVRENHRNKQAAEAVHRMKGQLVPNPKVKVERF